MNFHYRIFLKLLYLVRLAWSVPGSGSCWRSKNSQLKIWRVAGGTGRFSSLQNWAGGAETPDDPSNTIIFSLPAHYTNTNLSNLTSYFPTICTGYFISRHDWRAVMFLIYLKFYILYRTGWIKQISER